MVRILGESIPFSFTLTSSRNDQLVTAVKTMDDASLNYDAVEKLFTLLTKKKYPHLKYDSENPSYIFSLACLQIEAYLVG